MSRVSTPLGRRVRAAVTDEALVVLIGLVLAAMAMQTGVIALAAVFAARVGEPLARILGASEVTVTLTGLGLVTWMALHLAYRVLGTGSPSGQTPGKRMTGLRVVGVTDGQPPGYRVALRREGLLLALMISVVGLITAARAEPLHDTVASTRVEWT